MGARCLQHDAREGLGSWPSSVLDGAAHLQKTMQSNTDAIDKLKLFETKIEQWQSSNHHLNICRYCQAATAALSSQGASHWLPCATVSEVGGFGVCNVYDCGNNATHGCGRDADVPACHGGVRIGLYCGSRRLLRANPGGRSCPHGCWPTNIHSPWQA